MPRPLLRTSAAAALLLTGVGIPCSLAMQAPTARPDPRAFEAQVRPLLAAHCATCHSAAQQVGGVDLSGADAAALLKQRRLWRRVSDAVESGTMPPPGAKELTPQARAQLVRWARTAAEYFDPADPAAKDPGPPVLRRLTVTEYNRTVRDLLGVSFDAAREVGLEDPERTEGFSNLAAALTLSPALLDKYLSAAEKIGERVFKDEKAKAALLAVEGANPPEREAARAVLTRLVRRAYRRPARGPEVERFLKVYDRARVEGGDHEAGVRAVLKPVLVSPYFLFRVEEGRAAKGAYRLNDHELAVRLSYFLWSTMPDARLFQLAEAGQLGKPEVLQAEVKRMLLDGKAKALTEEFAEQWLQTDRLAKARPSTEFFPAFNGKLRGAMHAETAAFFDNLWAEDRSVLDLLDADYTFVNADLAKHYGISGVTGNSMQRVALKPEHRRGGLLGMGSVLALTSHTFRTSPTLRGKYVLEVILGTPPPPPPPDAAGKLSEEKGKEPRSFREQLAAHAGDPSCAGCHRKLDPLGFALDNYDAVGAWRESTPERPLDTSGELPGGEKLNGAAELKAILLKRKGQFARNLAARMLSYALGRELRDEDEWAIRGVAAGMEKDGYRFSALVDGIVGSVPFQYRRDE